MAQALVAPDGVKFGLTDLAFDQWWQRALLPEDAEDFVHLRGGNKLGARFVCALDSLLSTSQQRPPIDVIVRAYVLARKLPDEMSTDPKTRGDAQCLYESDAVEGLLDRLRYRETRAAMDRVAKLTLATVESALKSDDTKEAMKAGVSLMAIDQRAREADSRRRDKRDYQEAIAASRSTQYDPSSVPTLDGVRVLLAQLRDHFGADVLRELFAGAVPIDGKASTATTIEGD